MFFKNNLIHSIVLAASLTACGVNDKKQDNPENRKNDRPAAVSAEAAKSELDSAPEYLIVKVPVDANGFELNESFETKEISESGSFGSAEATASSFDAGADANVVNELDTDTSSQQWLSGRGAWYWNTPWYPGKLLGRGLWWGRNPYRWYGGYQYGYNHYQNHNYGGCNYYVYQRPVAMPLPATTPVQMPIRENYPNQQYPGNDGNGNHEDYQDDDNSDKGENQGIQTEY